MKRKTMGVRLALVLALFMAVGAPSAPVASLMPSGGDAMAMDINANTVASIVYRIVKKIAKALDRANDGKSK